MMKQTLYPAYTIILVDDEAAFLSAASFALRREGITNVETITDSRLVMPRLAQGGCGVLILDMNMPFVTGLEILKQAVEDFPEVIIFMITAVNDIKFAVDCMKIGARDYIVKPLQQDQFLSAIRRAIELKNLESETSTLKEYILDDTLKYPNAFSSIITIHPTMRNLFKYVEAIAGSDLPVLITGETGTGKELMAQAIHALSKRTGSCVCVNIAGIDDSVLSDTLFGHVRGAFTGADRNRKGLIEEASQGTIFLDEIGDLRPESQTKLLRLIQEGTYHSVGSDTASFSSARVIVATNHNLKSLMKAGQFRKDLYYRLQAHEITLPPLRDRLEDIRLLAPAFIEEGCKKLGKTIPHINAELYPLLSTYPWPGNIRELRGLLFDAVSRNETTTLSLGYLKDKFRELRGEQSGQQNSNSVNSEFKFNFPSSLPTAEEMELLLIHEALRRTGGNKSQAADLLGLARATVIKRLKEAAGEKDV